MMGMISNLPAMMIAIFTILIVFKNDRHVLMQLFQCVYLIIGRTFVASISSLGVMYVADLLGFDTWHYGATIFVSFFTPAAMSLALLFMYKEKHLMSAKIIMVILKIMTVLTIGCALIFFTEIWQAFNWVE
jgi:hypothetical protein